MLPKLPTPLMSMLLMGAGGGVGGATDDWILGTGFWDDSKHWDDTKTWRDA
jgi:hypothetical protein